MLAKSKDFYGQLQYGTISIGSVYIGLKNGAMLLWESISNCIAGGWWQHRHGWQYGTGWYQKN